MTDVKIENLTRLSAQLTEKLKLLEEHPEGYEALYRQISADISHQEEALERSEDGASEALRALTRIQEAYFHELNDFYDQADDEGKCLMSEYLCDTIQYLGSLLVMAQLDILKESDENGEFHQ